MTGGGGSEVFFEFTQWGAQMRVAAIDAATATEVVVVMPLSATKQQMQTFALAKLRRKMAEPATDIPPPAPPPRGKLA
jgi:hypothetical protein